MTSSIRKHNREIQFVLQNLFIFTPNHNSRYKLRLIVRDRNSEQCVQQQHQRYSFKFIFKDEAIGEGVDGEIYLLEKGRNEIGSSPYQEIGIGKIDIAVCQQRQQYSEDNQLINGLIYGINEMNHNKIIAKFSYKMVKKTYNLDEDNQLLSVSQLASNKRRQKLPTLTFRHSIFDQNIEISNKLNDLTKELDNTLRKDKASNEKINELNQIVVQTLRDLQDEQKIYHYKYSEKMLTLIENGAERIELYKITIRNIKINDINFRKIQKLTSNIYLNPYKGNPPKDANKTTLKICLYEIFEQCQFKRKLVQLLVPITINQNNHFPKGIIFYLPKTSNRILLEITNLPNNQNRDPMVGYVVFGSILNAIVQIFDEDNQEKGFLTILFNEEKKVNNAYIEQYMVQLNEFQQQMDLYKTKQTKISQRRLSLPAQKGRTESRLKESVILSKDVIPQTQQSITPANNYKKFRKIIRPQFFGKIKTQQNETFTKSRIFKLQQSTYLKKSRVKQLSSQGESSKGKVRLFNINNSRRKLQLQQLLHLNGVSISLTSTQFGDVRKVLLRFDLKDEAHMKKVYINKTLTEQSDWNNVNFEIEGIEDNNLKIACYIKERKNLRESEYRQLGRCCINIEDLRIVESGIYHALLASTQSIIGKISLRFGFTHSRSIARVAYSNQRSHREEYSTEKEQYYELSLGSSIVNGINPHQVRFEKKTEKELYLSKVSERKSVINKDEWS